MTIPANLTDLQGNSSYQSPYPADKNSSQLQGIDMQRAAVSEASIAMNEGKLPPGFPLALWEEQQRRYRHNWRWFTGEYLNESKGTTRDGEIVYRFPLKINAVRNFSRKHAALLLGEIPEHNSRPLIKTSFKPVRFDTESPSKDEKKSAEFYSEVVNRVWSQSNGDAIIAENATLSQFLGGNFFTLHYVPWRTDLPIPLQIRNPKPDFVLPIWSGEDPFDLLEAYIVYRIPAPVAEREWGIKVDKAIWVTFAEHWTKTEHSIYVDGKPLTANYQTVTGQTVPITYNKARNPFGFVPVFYIPRFRESGFYGSDLVVDIEGLMLELNGRMADAGSVVMKNAHRKWFGRNVQGNPRIKMFDNSSYYTDLGMENPSVKHPPEIWAEDPPQWSTVLSSFLDQLWTQLLREGSLTPVAFGEDEGSQRSALTLAIRFWPTTVLAKTQRVYWTAGVKRIATRIIEACAKLGLTIGGRKIPLSAIREFEPEIDWLPMVPRDREQTINEVVLLSQTNRMSLERALDLLGDIKDKDAEVARIWDELKKRSELEAEAAADQQAQTDIQTPSASDGMNPDD